MVTWAENTVHTFGKDKAPDSTSFSTPPASGGMTSTGFSAPPAASPSTRGSLFGFGSSSTPTPSAGTGFAFGSTPAPAPSTGGGFFSSSPAPTTAGGGLFGSGSAAPTPATGSSLFGQTPAPTSTFGSSSTGLFGGSTFGAAPAPSLFGTPAPAQTQQQPKGPLIPAEAALQATLHANARNEESRVQNLFLKLQEAYTDGPVRDEKSHPLSTVVYDPASEHHRQLKAIGNSLYYHANGTGGSIVDLPNPPQLTRDDWNLAKIRNPAPETHVPQVMVGAGQLQARGLSHQQQAQQLFGVHVVKLREARDLLVQRQLALTNHLEVLKRRNADLKLLLLRVLKYVHIFRCFQQPLQEDEMKAQDRLIALQRKLNAIKPPTMAASFDAEGLAAFEAARADNEEKWMTLVQETRAELTRVTTMLQEDQRELKLIHKRVVDNVTTNQRR